MKPGLSTFQSFARDLHGAIMAYGLVLTLSGLSGNLTVLARSYGVVLLFGAVNRRQFSRV